jgi:hypothetical protein
MRRESGCTRTPELHRVQIGVGLALYHGNEGRYAVGIDFRHDQGIRNPRDTSKHMLDVAQEHLLAGYLDHVVAPSAKDHAALRVADNQIA